MLTNFTGNQPLQAPNYTVEIMSLKQQLENKSQLMFIYLVTGGCPFEKYEHFGIMSSWINWHTDNLWTITCTKFWIDIWQDANTDAQVVPKSRSKHWFKRSWKNVNLCKRALNQNVHTFHLNILHHMLSIVYLSIHTICAHYSIFYLSWLMSIYLSSI